MKIMKVVKLVVILALFAINLTGCKKENSKTNEGNSEYAIVEVNKGNDVIINSKDIIGSATYYNYTASNTAVQIFAVKASDDSVRVLFNTCAACNPAPLAYFVQKDEYFECQACGNKFHKDDIGLTKIYGCSPIPILNDDKIIDGNTITIKSEFIETYKSKFESINHYENGKENE